MTTPAHDPQQQPPSASRDPFPVRPHHLLRVRAVWAFPVVLTCVAVGLITTFYVGSVVNPMARLHNLPVMVVDQDQGATLGGRHVNLGRELQAGLAASPAVTGRLRLRNTSLSAAERTMDRGGAYATMVIPPEFTAALVTMSELPVASPAPGRPRIEMLTNQRAGMIGANLATGVLQPALDVASRRTGQRLAALIPAGSSSAASRAVLTDPITVTTNTYRPLPPNTALGQSAFYLSLLTLMCGFLTGIALQSGVDGALGYAATELGPRWRQRQPLPINRWRTLLIKWAMAVPLTALVTALMLAVATGALGIDAPRVGLLWPFMWLCAASVAAGTLVVFVVFGAPGQVAALVIFVYLGLASAGGIVPVEALPTPLRWLSEVDPLRQIFSGIRAILYLDARADAGLSRGVLEAALGLLFWLLLGAAVVRWYDRRGFHRLSPEMLAYVSSSFRDYQPRAAESSTEPAAEAGAPARVPPSGEVGTEPAPSESP